MRFMIALLTLFVLSTNLLASVIELDHCEHETQTREHHSSQDSQNCDDACSIYHHVTVQNLQTSLPQIQSLPLTSRIEFQPNLHLSNFPPLQDRPPII